ncbi:MAG: hypothetical protein ACJAVY_001324 [Marinoscillum sp.]|jgi:hypothetical protein
MNEGISFYTILITAVFIFLVALIAALAWIFDGDDLPEDNIVDQITMLESRTEKLMIRAKELNMFDDEEQPKEKVDDQNDYNHRTG